LYVVASADRFEFEISACGAQSTDANDCVKSGKLTLTVQADDIAPS